MVGIRLACNPSSPLGLSGDANGFVPTRKTEERLALPVRSALTRFTEDRARAHARRSCTSHLTVVRKAASELHWSRLVTPIRSRKRLQSQWFSGVRARRSEQAKLTACRKVGGMYRRVAAKSRQREPMNCGFFGIRGHPRHGARRTGARCDRRSRPPQFDLPCPPTAAR